MLKCLTLNTRYIRFALNQSIDGTRRSKPRLAHVAERHRLAWRLVCFAVPRAQLTVGSDRVRIAGLQRKDSRDHDGG